MPEVGTLGNRLEKEELLEHPVRVAIMNAVDERPGASFLELFDRFKKDTRLGVGMGHGSLQHHINLLERHGFLTDRKSGRHRRYYRNGGAHGGSTTALALLQVAGANRIARQLLQQPGLSQMQVLERLPANCSRQAVSYHLRRLTAHGLLTLVPVRRSKTYYATELLLRLMPFADLGLHGAPTATSSTLSRALSVPST